MSKKKVIFIIDSLKSGGAEKVLVDILENLNSKEYDVRLLLINKVGEYIKSIPSNVKVMSLIDTNDRVVNLIDRIKFRIFFYFPRTIEILMIKEEFDIGIAFMEGDSTRIISKFNNIRKKIAWVHTDVSKHSNVTSNSIYNKFNNIVCVSKNSSKSFVEKFENLKDRTCVIYNPVNKEKIVRLSNKEEVELSNNINLLTIGRLVKEKGYSDLIHAHKILLDKGINNNLYIIGKGNDEDVLKKLAQKIGVEASVIFLGFKENPYPYLKKCDIFVSSSYYEGFSLVLAEALILNKRIVATDTIGAREILNNGEFGDICNVGDYNDLAEKLQNQILKVKDINISENENKFNRLDTFNEIKCLLNS